MAWKITCAGNDVTDQIDSLQSTTIDRPLNERAQAHFTTIPGTLWGEFFVFLRYQEVVMYAQDGTTPIFGGIILRRRVYPVVESAILYRCDVECGGFATYADYCSTSLSYTSPVTLIDVLGDLIADPLSNYGITLDGAQVTGPTLAPFAWQNKRVSDALRELMDRTGYVYAVNPSKALKAFIPGTDAAPFDMADHPGDNENVRSVEWVDNDRPVATDIIVTCGPDGTESVTQRWIQAGGATSWVADIAAAPNVDPPGSVTVNAVTKTVGVGANYTWNPTTHTLTLGTDTLPTNGWEIVLVYVAQFPFVVTATTGTTPVIEFRQSEPDIRSVAAGQEVADTLLDQMSVQGRDVTIMTNKYAGWDAGQTILGDFVSMFVGSPDEFIITNVHVMMKTDGFWSYILSATMSASFQGGWLQRWRELGVTGATK